LRFCDLRQERALGGLAMAPAYGSFEQQSERRYQTAARKSVVIAVTVLALTCLVGALVVVSPSQEELMSFVNVQNHPNTAATAAYAKKVNHNIIGDNGTICLNETRWNKNKDKQVVYGHNCLTSGWGSVSKTECAFEHRINPNKPNPNCDSEYLMLYQEFSKIEADSDEATAKDQALIHHMQEWVENGRNCLCLVEYEQCMRMIFPSTEAGGYFYGSVRLNADANKCTPFIINEKHMICSAYPAEPPEYYHWCMGAVHGQGKMAEGHVRLYDRDDDKHASLMRWNFAEDPEFMALVAKEGGDWNAGIYTRKGTWNRTYDCSEFDADESGCENAHILGKPCAWGGEDQVDINGDRECINTNDARTTTTAERMAEAGGDATVE